MKTNPSAEGTGWDVSFWFAVSSPFLGVLLGILALAIFVLEKSNRGLRGLNGSEGICVSSAVSASSAVQQFFKFLGNVGLQKLEKNSVKTNRTVQDSGWDLSFWFVVTSPLLGVLFGFLGLVIFCRGAKKPGA